MDSYDGGQSWQNIPLPESLSTSLQSDFTLPSVRTDDSTVNTVVTWSGHGFDKCEAPKVTEARSWKNSSPFGAVNLYVGGNSRACANDIITASYVAELYAQGWRFIPTWVGPQAPCTSFRNRFSELPATAYQQGVENAAAAVSRMIELGFTDAQGRGAVVYYDMEYFPYSASCSEAVRAFVRGWNTQLKQSGFTSGLYATTSNLSSNTIYNLDPATDAVWMAEWYKTPGFRDNETVWDQYYLPNNYWSNHQRIHQYSDAYTDTWGGVSMNVGPDVLDGPVAVPYQRGDGLPVTSFSLAGSYGVLPWFKTPVTVTLSATDDQGVLATYYKIDAGSWKTYTAPFTIEGSGEKTFSYMSVDINNNWEGMKTSSFRIDTVGPEKNPRVVSAGCPALNGAPQAKCSDAAFTWSGAADSGVGLPTTAIHQIYWGTLPNGTGSTVINGNFYNPPAVPAREPYYLRIRTQDKNGNWSNWETIYTLIYDPTYRYRLSLPFIFRR